jgi:hypothetical protein
LRFNAFEAVADFRDPVLSRRDDAALLVRPAAARGLERAAERPADFATGCAVRAREIAARAGGEAFDAAG